MNTTNNTALSNTMNNIAVASFSANNSLSDLIKTINHITNTKSKNDFLPPDVKEIIVNTDSVIVKLFNGKTGVSIVDELDILDPYVGFCIAYYKAHNTKSFRLKEALTGCVNAALRKGYKQAILKNYDEVKK